MADVTELKMAVRHKEAELRDLLNGWDPLGVYEPESGAPLDEYDCLHKVIGTLQRGASEAEISAFLTAELRDHFGIDPEHSRPADFAATLYAWYWADPLPGSVLPHT
jgi:hypothetical protein